MPLYVAFLGSINVGANRLRMVDLRAALAREDFEDVETVVASGNVLFSHDERPTPGLSEKLAAVVLDRFDIDTVVIVQSRDEVAAAISGNPFADDGEEKLVHTLLLEWAFNPADFEQLIADYAKRGPERIAAGERTIYIDYVEGVGASKLTNAFIERRLGCRETARNMRSLRRILQKMDESEA